MATSHGAGAVRPCRKCIVARARGNVAANREPRYPNSRRPLHHRHGHALCWPSALPLTAQPYGNGLPSAGTSRSRARRAAWPHPERPRCRTHPIAPCLRPTYRSAAPAFGGRSPRAERDPDRAPAAGHFRPVARGGRTDLDSLWKSLVGKTHALGHVLHRRAERFLEVAGIEQNRHGSPPRMFGWGTEGAILLERRERPSVASVGETSGDHPHGCGEMVKRKTPSSQRSPVCGTTYSCGQVRRVGRTSTGLSRRPSDVLGERERPGSGIHRRGGNPAIGVLLETSSRTGCSPGRVLVPPRSLQSVTGVLLHLTNRMTARLRPYSVRSATSGSTRVARRAGR
jgi:hypothetical protein